MLQKSIQTLYQVDCQALVLAARKLPFKFMIKQPLFIYK
jgi:hypothetical protein